MENTFPWCGKHAATLFHGVEKSAKHVSIVWKTPETGFHCVETFSPPFPPSAFCRAVSVPPPPAVRYTLFLNAWISSGPVATSSTAPGSASASNIRRKNGSSPGHGYTYTTSRPAAATTGSPLPSST